MFQIVSERQCAECKTIVCVSVCLHAGNTGKQCKNGWTDWAAVSGIELYGPKEQVSHWGPNPPLKGKIPKGGGGQLQLCGTDVAYCE